jgi:hypothetical protein
MKFSDQIQSGKLKEWSILDILLSSTQVNWLVVKTLEHIGKALNTSDISEVSSLFKCKKQELDSRLESLQTFLEGYTHKFFLIESETNKKKCKVDYGDDSFDESYFLSNIDGFWDVVTTLFKKRQEIDWIVAVFPEWLFGNVEKKLNNITEDIETIVCQLLIALINKSFLAKKRPLFVTYLRGIPQWVFSSWTYQEIQQTLKDYDNANVFFHQKLWLLRGEKNTLLNQSISFRNKQFKTFEEFFQFIKWLEEDLNYFWEAYSDFEKIKWEIKEVKTFFQTKKDEIEENIKKGIEVDFSCVSSEEDLLVIKWKIDNRIKEMQFFIGILWIKWQNTHIINWRYSYHEWNELSTYVNASKRIDIPNNKITQDFKNIGDLLLGIKNNRIAKQSNSIISIVEIFLSNLSTWEEFTFHDLTEAVKKNILKFSGSTVLNYLNGFKKRYNITGPVDWKYKKEL